MINEQVQLSKFSLQLGVMYNLRILSMIRVFGFQLRFDNKRQRVLTIPSSSAHTPANSRACISRLREQGGDERSIPSIEGTRAKLIEKHFDTTSMKNKRSVRRPGPVLPFIERTRSWSSKPRRKERTRATWRKKALTTKANMVVNERVASTFSVPQRPWRESRSEREKQLKGRERRR